jgi:hypothetical protein
MRSRDVDASSALSPGQSLVDLSPGTNAEEIPKALGIGRDDARRRCLQPLSLGLLIHAKVRLDFCDRAVRRVAVFKISSSRAGYSSGAFSPALSEGVFAIEAGRCHGRRRRAESPRGHGFPRPADLTDSDHKARINDRLREEPEPKNGDVCYRSQP